MPQVSRPVPAHTPPLSSRPVANDCAPPSRTWLVMLALGSVMLLASLVTGSVYLVSKLPRPDLAAETSNPPAAPTPAVPDVKSPKASLPDEPKPPPKAGRQRGAVSVRGWGV